MAQISEVFGTCVDRGVPHTPPAQWTAKTCPFTGSRCDVTGNRSRMSFLNPPKSATPEEKNRFVENYGQYGKPDFPFSICSISTQRRSSGGEKPWIVCPKRMLDLRPPESIIPPEIRTLMPRIHDGQPVRVWWEVKFKHRESEGTRNFDYTFDFLLVPIRYTTAGPRFDGPPYALEIMTASTRGGGLTEHLWDVLL